MAPRNPRLALWTSVFTGEQNGPAYMCCTQVVSSCVSQWDVLHPGGLFRVSQYDVPHTGGLFLCLSVGCAAPRWSLPASFSRACPTQVVSSRVSQRGSLTVSEVSGAALQGSELMGPSWRMILQPPRAYVGLSWDRRLPKTTGQEHQKPVPEWV